MGLRRIPVLVGLIAALCTILPVGTAYGKACGDIRVHGSYYIVGGAKASCDFMRRWSRSLIKRNGGPGGWDCHRRAWSGGCTKHTGARIEPFFIYYPPD
jgi:hypothetical protein